jgi:pimeloyl-ACP methyl ester carboxylesterase
MIGLMYAYNFFRLDGYSWRAQEAAFNDSLPQFRTTIRCTSASTNLQSDLDVKVHFVHVRSQNPNAVPLLFCHGWPSSFTEVSPIIKFLTEAPAEVIGADTSFHVVAASIPGFGFSDVVSDERFGPKATAVVYDALMKLLGYEVYIAHGDGWYVESYKNTALRC